MASQLSYIYLCRCQLYMYNYAIWRGRV